MVDYAARVAEQIAQAQTAAPVPFACTEYLGEITSDLELSWGGSTTTAFTTAAGLTLVPGPCLLSVCGSLPIVKLMISGGV